jgi:hypothetical protein
MNSADEVCSPLNAVFKRATAKFEAEQKQIANIQAGSNDASWVDKQLRELNCEGLD